MKLISFLERCDGTSVDSRMEIRSRTDILWTSDLNEVKLWCLRSRVSGRDKAISSRSRIIPMTSIAKGTLLVL
jgi:hypothetical protein